MTFWGYATINICAVFITYHLTHMNNLKVLREKWISEVRNASCNLIEAYEKLYYTNDWRCQRLGSAGQVPENERVDLIMQCESAQAHATAARANLQLLFKDGDQDYTALNTKIDELQRCVDLNSTLVMDSTKRYSVQGEYLKLLNTLLQRHWNEISESTPSKIYGFICKKICKTTQKHEESY